MTTTRRRPKLHERMEAVRLHRPGGHAGEGRRCAWPGCEEEGCYPAPRSRENLRDYLWFCLAHVREYNARWDYFAGMSAAEIEAHRRADVTWHRPSWRFGTAPRFDPFRLRFEDVHRIFEEMRRERAERVRRTPTGRLEEAMAVMGLEPGFDLAALKRRYKELVKRHHPDLRGGDRRAEERLKRINEAYSYLRAHLQLARGPRG